MAGVNFGKGACERLDAFGASDPVTGKSPDGTRDAIKAELAKVFGADVINEHLLEVYHKAWITDGLTLDEGDGGALNSGADPRSAYGHELLRKPTEWGVHFAGTETEPRYGHVDGAVAAGERAASEVLAAILTADPRGAIKLGELQGLDGVDELLQVPTRGQRRKRWRPRVPPRAA